MRIANLFAILLFAIAGIIFYINYDTATTGYMPRWSAAIIAACVIGAAVVVTLSNQINWWWFERYPPQLDETATRILHTQSAYFRNLATSEKKRFASRVYMFLMDKDFISKGTPEEDVPEDIKVMIAACVIQFTFGQKEYWLPDLEKIIVYPKLFLTRERYGFHAGEAHDDGCMLLSGIAMREGLVNPNSYYHIGLHVAAEYWNLRQAIHHSEFVFEDKDSFLEKLLLIRMFKRDFWRDLTGLHPEIHLTEAAHQTTFDDTNSPNSQKALATKTENDTINNAPPAPLFELAVECFFTKPAEMAAALPDTYIALSLILNQDPLKETYPVLVK